MNKGLSSAMLWFCAVCVAILMADCAPSAVQTAQPQAAAPTSTPTFTPTVTKSLTPADKAQEKHLTPVILFPGWGVTRLKVSVENQWVAPECPASGTFEYGAGAPPSKEFNQVCMDKLLTLVYTFDTSKSPPHVSEQRGVQVSIADYGKIESSPVYGKLFVYLAGKGYKLNVNLRVAGYDFRLTPDMGGFMERTTKLIEETYQENGNTPVHLVGHSNGPLYVQYLLTHSSKQWKDKYIQGFTSLAGNYPGQGGLYSLLFTGFNALTGESPKDPASAASSAAMYESHPSTYMTASDPAYFKDHEVVIRVAGGKEYTPQDYQQLFSDAKLSLAQKIAPYYFGLVKFEPPDFPNVDVYAEKGSGLDTIVGIQLPDLTVGQPLGDNPVFITMKGDSNQEDITNNSVMAWKDMPCYHFELNDNPGVDHSSLAINSLVVWDRLLKHIQQQKSECP